MRELSLRDFLDNSERAGTRTASADPRPARFHRSIPGYAPTALAEAPGLAERLGLARLS